jgi:hypothetical protein
MTTVQPPPVVLSIVPALQGGAGHMLNYHLAVGRAAALNGWRAAVATSAEHGLQELPAGWSPTLATGDLELGLPKLVAKGRVATLFRQAWAFAASIEVAALRELSRTEGDCILFLERFNGLELLGFWLAVRRLPASRTRAWLMFRHEPSTMGSFGAIYCAVARRMAARLRGRFNLLVDSEPLRVAVQRECKLPADVMPIPHTGVVDAAPFPKQAGELVCWWPGAPRAEKGWDAMRRIASSDVSPHLSALRLVAARSAGLQAQAGSRVAVHELDDALDPPTYQRWLHTVDAVLLPYDVQRYRAATSGIFTEAVVAGAVPFVSAGTWMAYELERFGLSELVCDWSRANIADNIASAVPRESMKERLARMRAGYARYHSEESFAQKMRELTGPRTRHNPA